MDVDGEQLLAISVEIDPRTQPACAHVTLTGELCLASKPVLLSEVDGLIDRDIIEVHVDLSRVSLCTAAGGHGLAQIRERLDQAGGALQLFGPGDSVRRVLKVCGVGELASA